MALRGIETDGKWKHWLTIVEPRLFGQYTQYIPFFSLVDPTRLCCISCGVMPSMKTGPPELHLQAAQPALKLPFNYCGAAWHSYRPGGFS